MILRVLVSMTDKAAPIAQIYAQLSERTSVTQENAGESHAGELPHSGLVGVQNEGHDYDANAPRYRIAFLRHRRFGGFGCARPNR